MARDLAVERTIQLQLAELSPEKMREEHARIAREVRAEIVAEAPSPPVVTTTVDGSKGASEDSVRAGGVIVYDFEYLRETVETTLAMLEAESPVRSGRYKRSWIVLVNGQRVDFANFVVPAGAEVIITNFQPYHRKINVGAMKLSVPPGIVERVMGKMKARYGNSAEMTVRYVELTGGYVLKRGTGRKGNRAGERMTYPALVIRSR